MTAPRSTSPGMGTSGLAMSSPAKSSRTQISWVRGWETSTNRARPRCFASRSAMRQKARWPCHPRSSM
eukprot:6669518-Lingulodinium_polyedra.AAC.1